VTGTPLLPVLADGVDVGTRPPVADGAVEPAPTDVAVDNPELLEDVAAAVETPTPLDVAAGVRLAPVPLLEDVAAGVAVPRLPNVAAGVSVVEPAPALLDNVAAGVEVAKPKPAAGVWVIAPDPDALLALPLLPFQRRALHGMGSKQPFDCETTMYIICPSLGERMTS
jgi:hypothetical protein